MALFLTVARAVLFAIVIHYAYDVYLRHLNHIMKKQKEVHNELEVYNMGHDLMEVTSEPDAALVSVHNDKESTALQVTEALTCLKSAMYLYEEGKLERATKLFDHAINLAPNHPDILNQYGHFIETVRSDVIAADHMYFKALIISPSHQGALDNRRRVAAVVEEIDKSILQKIDEKRDRVASIPESNFALRKAKREAYFQHIYHTVGIEGNTMTLSQTRSIVETRMAIGGKSIAEHNEILGLDSAVKYLNATLGNRHSNITIENILEIHKRVLGHVDPTEGGFFRRAQVFVGDHIPPGPSEIVKLMNEFEIWINTWGKTLHPVEHAALAHYRLVHIHPFYDGNGRTARLVMNMILMRAGFPPVIILKQDRQKYYELLEIGNGGDVRPFVRFIAQCTERTLDHFLWTTSEFSSEIPAIGKIDGYTSAITPHFGYPYRSSSQALDQ